MKITEILIESQQQELTNEGPIGDVAKKVAKGAGKAIGGVGKVAGAIAGIPGGLKRAFQQGKDASQNVIGGTGKGADAPEPVGTAVPAAQGTEPAQQPAQKPQGFIQGFKQGLSGKAPQTTSAINKQGPSGTAPAKVAGGAQQQALDKTAQATGGDVEKTNQTVYAQVKSQINNLDKKGKQRILQLLQKSLQQTPAKPAAAPAAPAQQSAAAPAAEPAQPAAGEQPAAAAGKKKPIPKKKVAPSQAEIDADRQRVMGVTSDSVGRTGRVVAESFTFYRR